ncbi:MAG TPA: hypothetical protein VGA36_09010 [Nitriliruptorales bacterium]
MTTTTIEALVGPHEELSRGYDDDDRVVVCVEYAARDGGEYCVVPARFRALDHSGGRPAGVAENIAYYEALGYDPDVDPDVAHWARQLAAQYRAFGRWLAAQPPWPKGFRREED